jgi:superfamily I DNA/RNA helicase
VRNILDFPGHFTPKAELITLEQNYRSTQPILAAANAVIDLASERVTKNLWSDWPSSDLPALVNVADDNAQAGYIVETILANREAGIGLKAQAVLFRTSSHSASLEVFERVRGGGRSHHRTRLHSRNSLLTGKRTGNFGFCGGFAPLEGPEAQ